MEIGRKVEGRKKKQKSIIIVTILILMLIVQACSTGNPVNKEETSNDPKDETIGGTLKVLIKSDATSLDPHFITNLYSPNIIYQKVYETLVVPDENMEPQPGLAKEWQQIDDLTWEFKLQEGVKFHDGTDFNAEAVKKTFTRVLDPNTGSPQRDKFSMIKEVAIVDDHTVRLILSKPYAPLLTILAAQEGSIFSPKLLDESPDKIAKSPVGTGPFKFEAWRSGQEITLIKNDDYWGQKPNFDRVEFKVIPEDMTRLAMLETGEGHISDNVPVNEIERIENSKTMDLYRTDGLGADFIGFRTHQAPVNNVLVRKAISHAIERESIISGVYRNVGALGNSTMSPKVFGFSKNIKPYEYDLNTAKVLLKEAGYPDGFKATLYTPDVRERISLAEVVQSQLKGIGIELEVRVLEYGAYMEATEKGEGHMFNGLWGNATGDGDYNQYNLFHSSSAGSPGNYFFYKNPEVDQLIEKGRIEKDPQQRKEIYEKTQKIQMEDAVYIPIRSHEHILAYSRSVEGVWVLPSSYMMFNKINIK
jgi:peptide/nickel transport system substrate-binding protein